MDPEHRIHRFGLTFPPQYKSFPKKVWEHHILKIPLQNVKLKNKDLPTLQINLNFDPKHPIHRSGLHFRLFPKKGWEPHPGKNPPKRLKLKDSLQSGYRIEHLIYGLEFPFRPRYTLIPFSRKVWEPFHEKNP